MIKMKSLGIILCLVMLSCEENSENRKSKLNLADKKKSSDISQDTNLDFKPSHFSIDKSSDSIDKIIYTIVNEKSGKPIELFDSLSSNYLIADSLESIIIVNKLKNQGFDIVNWGRGNFPKGPRIVSLDLQKGDCICTVNKKYYTVSTADNKWEMTETISCSALKEY